MNSSAEYVGCLYRLYPTKKQKPILNNYMGANRFMYNHCLEENTKYYEETGKFLFYYDLVKKITTLKKTAGYEWLKDIPIHIIQNATRNFSNTLSNFCKEKCEFPRFKSRKRHEESFTLDSISDFKILYEEKKLKVAKLFKIAGLIKVVYHKPIIGKPKSITISRDPAGNYWLSICCDVSGTGLIPSEKVKEIKNAVGCDLGIKDRLITSDGEVFENKKFLKKNERRLKIRQRRFSRKQKDSNNHEKARKVVAKTHSHIKNCRKDQTRKMCCLIAKNNDLIVMETLNVKGMLQNHKLAKSLNDVSFYAIKSEMEWQCKKRGKYLVFIDQWFPSSQTCSNCGFVNKEVKNLGVREWKCPVCGKVHDRDINAATNILHEGLRKAINDEVINFRQIPQELRKFTLVRYEDCSKDLQGKKL